MPTPRRIRVILSYDGTDFFGWQVQPGLPTIQAALQSVLQEIEGPFLTDADRSEPRPPGSGPADTQPLNTQPPHPKQEEIPTETEAVASHQTLAATTINVAGSGRTDAGVHAIGQVAAFNLHNPIPLENLQKVMNRRLPRDIRVVQIEEVPEAFHPRFDALAKTYEYRILRTEVCSPFDRRYIYHFPYPLNEARMIEYAPLLEGDHDFTAFAASDEKDSLGRSKVRKIFSSRLTQERDRLIYRVTGSGFLKHMVRNIVGVLLEVGKGNLSQADLLNRLQPGSGIPAGPTAPARGLFLVKVNYPK